MRFFRPWSSCHLILLLLMLLVPIVVRGQESRSRPGLELPQDPSLWVNSGPIKIEALQGKAALLWFYEEQCPKCRAKWPALIELSQKYAGKPIAFIAVNSGNSRQSVEQYARGVNLTWPVIVDPLRQFEQASGVTEISLMNIYQVKTITPQGQLASGNWDDLEGTVEKVLAGAKWNVDPVSIPAPLKPAWTAVEFGDYASGAALIKKGLNANKVEIKAAATTLNDYVQTKIDAAVAEAQQDSGTSWQRFRAYQTVAEQFAGYELPEEVAATLKELASDKEVMQEQALFKQVAAARKAMRSTARNARVGAVNRLKKLVAEHPESAAAKEAAALIAQGGMN